MSLAATEPCPICGQPAAVARFPDVIAFTGGERRPAERTVYACPRVCGAESVRLVTAPPPPVSISAVVSIPYTPRPEWSAICGSCGAHYYSDAVPLHDCGRPR